MTERRGLARFFHRRRNITEEPPAEQVGESPIPRTPIEMAQGARNIMLAVNVNHDSPLFISLPQILTSAPEDAKVQLVLMGEKGAQDDPEVMAVLKEIAEISRKRNERGIFPNSEIGEEDLEKLSLELQGNADHDYLTVFIQDPQNPKQYWFRKFGVRTAAQKIGDIEVEALDITFVGRGSPLETVPCPKENLPNAIETMSHLEAGLADEKPELAALQATVGLAKYTGDKEISLDAAIRLTALKYIQLRKEALQKDK